MNEIAIQLAHKSRRNKKILMTILMTAVVIIAGCFIISLAGMTEYKYMDNTDTMTTVDLKCSLNDEEYYFSITYDEQYCVREAGGD